MIENLENRKYFWVATDDGNTLTIYGDNTDEIYTFNITENNEVRMMHPGGYTQWENKLVFNIYPDGGIDNITVTKSIAAETHVKVNLGAGDDIANVTGTMIDVYGGSGNDVVDAIDDERAMLEGGDGDDIFVLYGNFSGGKVFGNQGWDEIKAGGVNEICSTFSFLDEPVYLHTGSQGSERHPSTSGGGEIFGTQFDDILIGSLGWDEIWGGGGDDYIDVAHDDGTGNDGYDIVHGQGGQDFAFIDSSDGSDAEDTYVVLN